MLTLQVAVSCTGWERTGWNAWDCICLLQVWCVCMLLSDRERIVFFICGVKFYVIVYFVYICVDDVQHYEDVNIKQFLDMKSIALYVRYVDDILIIYNTTKINLHPINTYINKIHNNMKLNPTYEEHNSTAFLVLTITRRHTKL